MSLVRKEFSASDYGRRAKKSTGKNIHFGLVIFIVFIIIAMVSRGSGDQIINISAPEDCLSGCLWE